MTRVAVIIPCFNDGTLAVEAVASVRESEPVEVVVVDDGSTAAATLTRLDDLRRSGVRVVRRDNGGPGAARMTGLHATSAPFVYVLDSDDLLEPGALAAMADTLAGDPQAGFTWGDYSVFGEYEGSYRSPRAFLPWTLTYVNPYPVCSMFRRDVLERVGGWKDRGYEDWDLLVRLAGKGVAGARTDRVVYHRRLHGDTRVQVQARLRHRELFADIRRGNAGVFARRRDLRRQERPPAWKRIVYPVMFGRRAVVPVRVEALMIRAMLRLGRGLPG